MRTNYSSKSAKISTRSLRRQTQNLTVRQKRHKEPSQGPMEEVDLQNVDLSALMKPKDVDQWIFSDQKMKIDSHNLTQNYQIRSRIPIHRKDRLSKQNYTEDKNKPKTTEPHPPTDQQPPLIQKTQQNEKSGIISPRQYSRAEIIQQQDNKNQLLQPDLSKQLTQRYTYTLYSAIRPCKHINTSMEINRDLNHFLKPTAFSIELKKPLDSEERNRSPKREKMNRTITCSPKDSKNMSKDKVNSFMRREFSVKTPVQRQAQVNLNAEKQRFLLNGWQVEPASFHDFDQLYRQKSRELERLPFDRQANTFKRKIVRMSVQ